MAPLCRRLAKIYSGQTDSYRLKVDAEKSVWILTVIIKILPVLFLVLMSGCQKADKAEIRLNDPLADLVFESFLIDAEIEYTKQPNGFYVSELDNLDAMEQFVEKAYESLNSTTKIDLKSPCVEVELSAYLDKKDAIFLIEKGSDNAILRTSTVDFEKLDVVSNIVAAEDRCHEVQYVEEFVNSL